MGLMSDGTYEVMQRLADSASRRRFVTPAPKGQFGDYIEHAVYIPSQYTCENNK
jgi:hypothetical protein